MEDGLFPVNPCLLRNFKIVSILLSALGGFEMRIVRFICRLFARYLARDVTFASDGVDRLAKRWRSLLLVRHGAVDIFRVLFRAEGVVFR